MEIVETRKKPKGNQTYTKIYSLLLQEDWVSSSSWVSREELWTSHYLKQEGDWIALVSQARGHTLGWLSNDEGVRDICGVCLLLNPNLYTYKYILIRVIRLSFLTSIKS